MAEQNGEMKYMRNGSMGRKGLPKIQTQKETAAEVCHDDSNTPVKANTLDELHSLQKKKSTPTTPIRGTPKAVGGLGGAFATISEEEDRQKQQLQSIRFFFSLLLFIVIGNAN